MAHRLDSEIHGMYNSVLAEVLKAKASKSKKKVLHVEYGTGTSSRDEAVRLRHKHQAVAKLLANDGYLVKYVPESDEMPKGKYDKPLTVGIVVEVVREDSDVSDNEG